MRALGLSTIKGSTVEPLVERRNKTFVYRRTLIFEKGDVVVQEEDRGRYLLLGRDTPGDSVGRKY